VIMLKTENRQTKRSISSRDTNMPKIIKSTSSIEKQKLDVLPIPKKDNPTVTKSHQDSHSNNSKSSAKASSWGSPDMSSGIEKLFKVMGL
jgi:BRCT domain type II-containing protein